MRSLVAMGSLLIVLIGTGCASRSALVQTPAGAPSSVSNDDDGDGVMNAKDRCFGSLAGQTIGPDGCTVPHVSGPDSVHFDVGSTDLRPDSVVILNEAMEVLGRFPGLRVEIAGHADVCGGAEANLRLSQRRAQAVTDYLLKRGINPRSIAATKGYGETRPLENTSQELPGCRSETNRRVVLNVRN